MNHKLNVSLLIYFAFTATCFAEFPRTGVVSVSPDKQYAIWSRSPWYAYPLTLLSIVTREIPRFSKTSMIDARGSKIYSHIESAGDWSDDSECYGGRKPDNHVVLYFPKIKKEIETRAFIWTKGKDDSIYLIDSKNLKPADSRVWQSNNQKEREINILRLSLSNPSPQIIGNFTLPNNTEAIVCMEYCGDYIRFGYSYSIYKNANPIVVHDPESSTFVSGRIALNDLLISNGNITQANVIKTTPEMRKACDCPNKL